MPLMHGGKKAVSANIHELHEANKGRSKPRGNKQIVAIALRAAREGKKPSKNPMKNEKGETDFTEMARRMKGKC
mgnify:CR=1 FL=1